MPPSCPSSFSPSPKPGSHRTTRQLPLPSPPPSPSLTPPRPSGRGGGTGLLLSPSWSFSVLPLSDISITSFEYHSVLINHPINLYIIVVYRPPGPLGCFLDELDTLLSSFPEDGTPLILLGDFNIHLDASQSAAFLPLLRSFDLTLQPSPPTHKAGNLLDLVFQRNSPCSDVTYPSPYL
ncbi:hypothetical protein SKAU_G00139320 [Synaphobranchus kaupii]|uniref:Endonuclease/exonuclease/phosphatase domain-containing protein n=1 Tax=Synaphobranchus kaupii TaxID=118154 RepID=A0A9Q1FSJ0_SYNKA|nr:hypothetical protein SKAU_G00139320 [Synaphobranchus kaupii]